MKREYPISNIFLLVFLATSVSMHAMGSSYALLKEEVLLSGKHVKEELITADNPELRARKRGPIPATDSCQLDLHHNAALIHHIDPQGIRHLITSHPQDGNIQCRDTINSLYHKVARKFDLQPAQEVLLKLFALDDSDTLHLIKNEYKTIEYVCSEISCASLDLYTFTGDDRAVELLQDLNEGYSVEKDAKAKLVATQAAAWALSKKK